MIRSDYMAIKPTFLEKYSRKYDGAMAIPAIQAGIVERILQGAQEDIDDQFKHVLKIDGDTAFINLFGPMSQNGPDWIDLYFGFNGVAYLNLIRASEEILKNDVIKNVFVNGNTPGGNIDGLDEAFKSLKFLSDKRPVTAINKGMIASAGVWYTSAAHKTIAANPAAMIGSIGVVIDTLDFTGYYNSFGIETITITNSDSPNKRPDLLTKEGKAIYIKELNSLFGVFLDRVTDGKPIKPDSVKALKGEMIIAADAVKIGLMDSIEGVEVSTTGPAGSSEPQTAEIHTEKELTMEADVKEALEKITTSVSGLATQVATLAKPAPAAETKMSDEDKTFALNIANGTAYPDAIKKEAINALAGVTEMSAFKTTVSVFDAIKEDKAGSEAGEAGDKKGETKPKGDLPGDKTEKNGNVDTDAEAQAEIDRINGTEV